VIAALVVAWALLLGLLILCGEGIVHSSGITAADQAVTRFVVAHRTPALNHVMTAVTWFGSWIATLTVAIIVTGLAWKRRLPVLAVPIVVSAWLGELLAVTAAKSVIKRPRPPEAVRLVTAHGWSFPSGHTANAMVVFATVGVLATTFARRTPVRALCWTLIAVAIALVGFSRIELGVHWLTDVVASMVWTAGWIIVVIAIHRQIDEVHHPAVTERSEASGS
jgi:undecaprenyl-diphosphatase